MHRQAPSLINNSKVMMKPSFSSYPMSQWVVNKNWPQQINNLQATSSNAGSLNWEVKKQKQHLFGHTP